MILRKIKLNFLDNYYLFYDWLEDDNIIVSDVVPHIVSTKILNDLINFKIKLTSNKILKKGMIHLFSDEFTTVVIKFSNDGYSLLKSSLLLEDELKILDTIQILKGEQISYEIVKKEDISNVLRIASQVKDTIISELNKMLATNNSYKIQYLYYEWFKQRRTDDKYMVDKMLKKLNLPISSKEVYIYNLIKRCYKPV